MTDVRSAVMGQLEPRATLVAFTRALVSTGPRATAPVDTTASQLVGVDTLQAAPAFHQPMYESLRDLSESLLLPGLDRVEPNRVVGLKTNRRFVDSYLVGLNFEMGRLLLWRGFPTDQRGTYFDQFWDAQASTTPRPDIEPIASWGGRQLGDAQAAPAREQFVILLRSDLLRRYPNAVIYATKAVLTGSARAPSADPGDEVFPAFQGSLPPDVAFFGFDLTIPTVVGDTTAPGYYVVIQEHAAEPKFGLDVGLAPAGVSYLSALAAPPAGVTLNGLEWGRNSAHMAGIVRRKPVRLAIHASQLVSPG
jgi:hypothetical protein